MFESLSSKLDRAFKTLKGSDRISETNVAQTTKEIRRALVDADVHYKVAKEFTDTVKEKALGRDVLSAVSPGQLFVKIVQEELAALMGGQKTDLQIKGEPAVILVAGLQGAGKTTFCGKLARQLKSQGREVMLAACDIYRPAAVEQLKTLGAQVGVDVYSEEDPKDAVALAKRAVEHAKKLNKRVVIVDTAGRLGIDEKMMDEIAAIQKALRPSETLFVVDAMTGQDAVNTAQAFDERLNFDGVVVTKLDGDTRGGAALSVNAVVGKPIKLVSTGEKMEALEAFHPERMASRILGMGDVVSLVEKAQENFDEDESRKLAKKLRKNTFDFEDFLKQLDQIEKMGNMKDLLGMIPGVGKMMKNVEVDEDAFKPVRSIIYSMTPHERQNPDLINGNRRKRLADGSGTSIQQVNQLMKQFEDMRKMMRKAGQMKGKGRGMMPGMPG